MAKTKVLLVEDNKLQADVIREFLEKNEYDVIRAEDGMSAFKAAKTEKIDIILLDRILPDIEGNEVCRWLKLDPATQGIPIIMLTAKDAVVDKIAGLEAGADDYIPKPFDERELSARIFVRLRTKAHHDKLHDKNRQLEDMLSRVETLAISDSLTGLFNRRRFESILLNEYRRAERYKNPLSLLIIDIDHFQEVNDVYGRQAGDTVLREVARIIRTSIRDVDIVARWGGEEFAVLNPNTARENAKVGAERILKAIAGHIFTGSGMQPITVSIGVAGVPDPSLESLEQLILAADHALNEAKQNGRNRVETA